MGRRGDSVKAYHCTMSTVCFSESTTPTENSTTRSRDRSHETKPNRRSAFHHDSCLRVCPWSIASLSIMRTHVNVHSRLHTLS